MTILVMPNDTNHLGNLMGGNLMKWMDECAAMCGMRHCKTPVVTISADSLTFKDAIGLGEIVTIEAKISRVFGSSMEIYVEVFAEDKNSAKRKCNEAFFTFVSVDRDNHQPIKAKQYTPRTDAEQELFDGALKRRQIRLITAGKVSIEEISDLKSLFV